MIKKISPTPLVLFLIISILFSGCFRTKDATVTVAPPITLTFYGLFDNEEIYAPIIQEYENQHSNVTIVYKKFTNPDSYLDLIINELAEGEGPDIFMMHDTWFPKNYKKLTPAPATIITPDIFRSLFVEVAGDELIIPDSTNAEQVWGLPLYIDTLALYYNKDHIEDALPSQGHPSTTWEGIKNDVVQLNRQDQSFERFERTGIALGRSDNILRAFDILMMMMLQYKVDFYTTDLTQSTLANDPNALSAMELFTSFGLPSQRNYSWNKYLADPDSPEKELATFAKGKLSMLLGYSYAYEDIINEINSLAAQGETTIDINNIKIQETPQVFDPETSAETREAYASYFVPVVSRTSQNPEVAWDFLATLTSENNLRYYNGQTHRPSALRSLIEEQMTDPIYGVFAAQVGYANSVPMADPTAYKEIFLDGVSQILDTAKASVVLKGISDAIQALIPSAGIKPIYVPVE